MREPWEMVTDSLMQSMGQIRKKNLYFVTKLPFGVFGKGALGALGVDGPPRRGHHLAPNGRPREPKWNLQLIKDRCQN